MKNTLNTLQTADRLQSAKWYDFIVEKRGEIRLKGNPQTGTAKARHMARVTDPGEGEELEPRIQSSKQLHTNTTGRAPMVYNALHTHHSINSHKNALVRRVSISQMKERRLLNDEVGAIP